MALKKGKAAIPGGSKKGVMFTLLTIILFVLMLAEVITYVVLNNTYNQQASEASAIIGAGSMVNTLRGGLGPFLVTSVRRAINVYLPAGAQLQYPLNSTASAALSSLVYNGMINGINYPSMNNATAMAFVSAMEKQASTQSSAMNIYNSSVRIYQDSPAYINVTYTGLAAINTTYGFFTYPLSVDVGYPMMISYINITLENAQAAATASPFQQMITFDPTAYSQYENSDLGNIRFYHGATPLFSWCESGCSSSASAATFWIALPGGIAADSNTVITMGFLPRSTEYSKAYQSEAAAPYAGEAPQLSSTYAEYDNGANVFNNYWNFAGTSLPSGLNAYGDTTDVTVDNGITIEPSTNTWTGIYSTATVSSPTIIETYATFPSTAGDGDSIGGYSSYAGGAGVGGHAAGQDWAIGTTSAGAVTAWSTNNTNTFPTSNTIFSFYFVSGALALYGNYIQQITLADSVTSDNIALGRFPNGAYTTPLTAVWLRTRAYPPNGVMPTASFGGLESV